MGKRKPVKPFESGSEETSGVQQWRLASSCTLDSGEDFREKVREPGVSEKAYLMLVVGIRKERKTESYFF